MTIAALVDRERRHLRRSELAFALLAGTGAAALVLALASVALGRARWLALPRPLPFLVWAVVAAMLAALALHTRRRLRRVGTRAGVAGAIEREQGLRRGLLVGAIELEGTGALAARAARTARASLPSSTPLAPAMRRLSSRRAMAGAGAAAAGLLVLLTASPAFGDGLRAVLRPIDAWRGALLDRPRIEGAPSEMLRGAPLAITVRAPGRTHVVLARRETGEAWRRDTIAVDPRTGTARWRLHALRGDLRLVATDGRASSDSVVVRAADRPFVGAVALRADYPAYLSRAPEALPVGELLRVPRGTVLTVTGRASVPLTSVVLSDGSRESFALATSGHTFAGRLTADRSMALRWTATGPGGTTPDLPPPLELEVVADSAPVASIVTPSGDTLLASEDRVVLTLTASDDRGLGDVSLRVARGAGAGTLQPVAMASGTGWAGGTTLDVAALRLQPGEVARVRAEAVDRSPWRQRGVSREIVVRRATPEEQRGVARALGDSAVKEARAMVAAQRALAQRTDEAARARGRQGGSATQSAAGTAAASPPTGAMSYDGAERARALAGEQRAMTDRVQKLREATAQLQKQLAAAGALDTSLARQLGEAQAMLRQALTPQMMAQMQKLESAAGQMNGEQSRDALRDLAQMQQRMREQLERSAEMLKRAAAEGAMQTLGDQARDLAAKERALADSARGDAAAKPREAQRLAQESERLREQMDALRDRLAKDKADAGASRTEQAGQHAAKSETQMRRAAAEMRADGSRQTDGQKAGAEKQGESSSGADRPGGRPAGEQRTGEEPTGSERAREAAAEMDRASKAMQDARAAQVKEWKQELTSELDQAVQEMMQLAREERALEQQVRSGAAGEDRRSAQSAVEQGVGKASERLQGAGKKSALLSPRSQRAVGDAKEKVSQATRSVTEPGGSASRQAGALGEAADALTRAAAALARDRERANSASSASGFSEMLQQMQEAAGKQGQINAQAQSLMSMPNPSAGAGQSLARALARQQRGVADQLEDAGDATGGDRAAQLAREARQLAEALEGGRMDAGTLARQQQLFRRLLDAGRSLEKEEREDSGKREAASATASQGFTPGAKADGRPATRFRPPTWEELRGLSAEERRAILEYFGRLNSASAP